MTTNVCCRHGPNAMQVSLSLPRTIPSPEKSILSTVCSLLLVRNAINVFIRKRNYFISFLPEITQDLFWKRPHSNIRAFSQKKKKRGDTTSWIIGNYNKSATNFIGKHSNFSQMLGHQILRHNAVG